MLGKNAKLCFGISIGVLVVAIVLATWGVPTVVDMQIRKSLQLENSSMIYEKWRKIPFPLDFKITLFNVTNPDEVNSGKKPKLQEVGPYVYKEYRERIILGYGENDTIKYMMKKRFYFDAKESGSFSEDDNIVVINFPYMAAMLTVSDLYPSMVPTINKGFEEMYMNLTDPFYRTTVKELLFDGLFLNCEGQGALGLICAQINSDIPQTMRKAQDRRGFYFSMFNSMNTTESGPFEMVRGIDDIHDLGHIVSYKGITFMENWEDPYCGQFNGSDGSIFPPFNKGKAPERLYTFQPDICRSMYMELQGERKLFDINAYYYELPESAFAAKSANPNNKCFCKKNWSANHDGCLIMGLLNLMPCQKAPAIISMPHYYLASEELLEFFDGGISPDKEKHSTYVYLDAVTGAIMKGVQRMQFSVELRKMNIPQLANVPTGLFPLLWMEESAAIPESIQEELRHSHTLLGYADTLRWAILAVAIIAVIASAIILARSGAIPIWPRNNNVTFVLHPPNASANKGS